MDQCGGDNEFLHEMLVETHNEITKYKDLENHSNDFIREHAHMVKGVARNLFCKDLENSSSNLEFVIISKENDIEIKKNINELKESVNRFENFLKNENII